MEQLAEEATNVFASAAEVMSKHCDGSGSPDEGAPPSLRQAFVAIQSRAAETRCTVAILALAKSGKSTLINALLNETLLPSTNVPETARIAAIQHAPATQAPLLSYVAADGQPVVVEGAAAIREHLRQLNADARGGQQGMVACEAPLQIQVAIAALAGTPGGAPGSRVTILDTPGPNEAGEDQLRFKVERLMEGVDAAVYILDWTKLKTCEEAALLRRLHELNPGLLRRLCHRLFFVVNKMDMAEHAEGMDAADTRAYVSELVTRQLNVPGFVLQPEQVFLVSALDALRARSVLRPGASAADLEAFRRAAFGKRWRAVTDADMIREAALEVLAGSGLPELEAGVLGFLGGHAALLHLLASLDDLERLLAQVHNLAQAGAASLRRGVEELSGQVAALQGRLASTLAEFEGVRGEVAELEGLVVDEVRERMSRLRERLARSVDQALTPAQAPAGAPHGRWPAVWAAAKALLRFGNPRQGLLEGVEGEQELQMKLAEMHSMIYLQIESETREFWHTLEQATNERQQQLFGAINARLTRLAGGIEAEVSGMLDCTLQPADIRLRPPSAEQFHTNLQELLAQGIQRSESQEVKEVTQERVVYVKRSVDSLCRRYEWWEPTTQLRKEEVAVTRTRYRPDPEAIKAYFLSVVNQSVANSVAAVRQYVRAYLAERLEDARGRLAGYARRYQAVMEEALAAAQKGEAEHAEALMAAEAHSASVQGLLARVKELQAQGEAMIEGWADKDEAIPEEEAAAGSSSAAHSTVAALARLDVGPPAELGSSQLSTSGSTAAEVAAAYAAQLAPMPDATLGMDAGSHTGGVEDAGGALLEVQLQEEATVAVPAPDVLAGAGSVAEADAEDWTLLSEGDAEEGEEQYADAKEEEEQR